MKGLPFLDIHTHRASGSNPAVYNLDQKDFEAMTAMDKRAGLTVDTFPLLSAGIHPWFVDKNKLGKQLRQLEKLAGNSRVRLIGECGLDKLRGPEMEIQKIAFAAQIQLANHYQKPLVIHCVRAYNELIAVTKVTPPKVPLILHGFNRGPELARQLTDHGYLLSFGANLAQKNRKRTPQ